MLLFILLPPFWAFLFSLLVIRKKGYANNKDLYILFFFLAILAIYWFPWGDTQTHFSVYDSSFIERYFSFSGDYRSWLYDLVIYYVANVMGNFQYGFLFWILFTFFVFIYSINSNKNGDSESTKIKYYWLYVLYCIMAIGIRELLDLNRSISSAFLLVSGVLLFKKNKVLSVITILLSLLLHQTALVLVIAMPISILLGKLKTKHTNHLFIIVAIFSVLIITIIGPYVLSERYQMYLASEQFSSEGGVHSRLMKLYTYVNIIIFFVNFYILQKNRDFIQKSFYNLHLAFALMVFVVFLHWIGRERYMIYYNIYTIAIIMIYGDRFKYKNVFNSFSMFKTYFSLFTVKIIIILSLTFAGRYVFNTACRDNERELKIVSRSLYYPTFLLLDIENYGFNDKEYNALYQRVIETNE